MSKSGTLKRAGYHHGNLKEALLVAAEAELVDRGIEAFSIRSVATRANVSHTALKPHFGNTEGLLTALCTIGFRRFLQTQDRLKEDAPKDAVVQLEAAGLGYIAFARENPALFRLMFSSRRPDFTSQALSDASCQAFETLEADVAAARHQRNCDPKGNAVAAASAWAMAHGLADLLVSGRLGALQSLDPEAQTHALSRMLSNSALGS